MIFWVSLGVILAIATFILIRFQISENNFAEWPGFTAVVTGATAFFMLLICFCCRMDYVKFEEKFEIQHQIYEQIESFDETNVLLIADIVDANSELAEYQASKNIYGFFSTVPDRVYDLTPIGIK